VQALAACEADAVDDEEGSDDEQDNDEGDAAEAFLRRWSGG
jgi:hypothetical protein